MWTCWPPATSDSARRHLLLAIKEINPLALCLSQASIKPDPPPKGFSHTFSMAILRDAVIIMSELGDLSTSFLLGSWSWTVWLNSLHQISGCQPYLIFSRWVHRWITTRCNSTFFIHTGLKTCGFIPHSVSASDIQEVTLLIVWVSIMKLQWLCAHRRRPTC